MYCCSVLYSSALVHPSVAEGKRARKLFTRPCRTFDFYLLKRITTNDLQGVIHHFRTSPWFRVVSPLTTLRDNRYKRVFRVASELPRASTVFHICAGGNAAGECICIWACGALAMGDRCISLMPDGPQRTWLPNPPSATLPSCLKSLRIFPYLTGYRIVTSVLSVYSFWEDISLLRRVALSSCPPHLITEREA